MQHYEIKILNCGDPPAYPDIKPKWEGALEKVCVLEKGMASGAASVGLLVKLPNGEWVLVQLSAGALVCIASAVRGAAERWKEGFPM